MASLQRIRCELTGTTALPGVATFYSEVAVPSAVADVAAFWDDVKALLPTGLTVTIPGSGDVIDDTDGALVGTWSEGSDTQVVGTTNSPYAAGVGARVIWRTNGVRNRRRVRGSTFLCPLVVGCYDSQGTLDASQLTTISTAAGVLASGGQLRIWSRPTTPTAADGTSNLVLSAQVPDRVTALRSRRY